MILSRRYSDIESMSFHDYYLKYGSCVCVWERLHGKTSQNYSQVLSCFKWSRCKMRMEKASHSLINLWKNGIIIDTLFSSNAYAYLYICFPFFGLYIVLCSRFWFFFFGQSQNFLNFSLNVSCFVLVFFLLAQMRPNCFYLYAFTVRCSSLWFHHQHQKHQDASLYHH